MTEQYEFPCETCEAPNATPIFTKQLTEIRNPPKRVARKDRVKYSQPRWFCPKHLPVKKQVSAVNGEHVHRQMKSYRMNEKGEMIPQRRERKAHG